VGANLDPRRQYLFSLVKLNEAICGPVAFKGILLRDGPHARLLEPPARPHRKLAFLGDSITCGYGALGVQPCPGYNCGAPAHGSLLNWESAYSSYGSVLGRRFHADTQIICVSGAGFAHNYSFPSNATAGGLTERFDYILGSGGNVSQNMVEPGAWEPDALVINVGTNDGEVPHSNTSSIWEQVYLRFLRKWRARWPNTIFLLGCFPMLAPPGEDPAIA